MWQHTYSNRFTISTKFRCWNAMQRGIKVASVQVFCNKADVMAPLLSLPLMEKITLIVLYNLGYLCFWNKCKNINKSVFPSPILTQRSLLLDFGSILLNDVANSVNPSIRGSFATYLWNNLRNFKFLSKSLKFECTD